MKSTATTPDEYLSSLPDDRRAIITALREVLLKNLPAGFTEGIGYGMLGYSVPHTLYPAGYHCNPKLPLPFISLGSQKNHISLHHMGLYEGELLDWFRSAWPHHSNKKLDMGKCCIRFKNLEEVPLLLIGELAGKMTPHQWIDFYEQHFKRAK